MNPDAMNLLPSSAPMQPRFTQFLATTSYLFMVVCGPDGAGTDGSTTSEHTTFAGSAPTETGANPTCDDGVLNQDETGIDCGGACAPCPDPVCAEGENRRCWVECVVDFPPGCFHSGLAPLLMGVEPCTAGQWGLCTLLDDVSCGQLSEPCANDDAVPTIVQCLDGTAKPSTYECRGQFGPECDFLFYDNWPYTDCEDVCLGEGDACLVEGEERSCDVHCDAPDGPVKQGMQDCREVSCDKMIWSACITNNACLNP